MLFYISLVCDSSHEKNREGRVEMAMPLVGPLTGLLHVEVVLAFFVA
jgi:hypothetical protein